MLSAPTDVLKMALKLGYAMSFIIVFIGLLNVAVSLIFVGLNFGVLTDLLYLIQMWLPFHLTPLIAWVNVYATAYLTYKLYLIGYNILRGLLE